MNATAIPEPRASGSESDSMAGSLTERRRESGDYCAEIPVECRRLSPYLEEPVHFLKLDIEVIFFSYYFSVETAL